MPMLFIMSKNVSIRGRRGLMGRFTNFTHLFSLFHTSVFTFGALDFDLEKRY